MISSSSSDHVALQIKEEAHCNKLSYTRRLLSKDETSAANPSFRVYYGVAAGAVPFLWESQPGTPKHMIATTTTTDSVNIPPLTPPPSYFSSPRISKRSSSKSVGFIHAILPRLALRRPPAVSRSSSVSSSSSSSTARSGHRRGPSCPQSSYFGGQEEEEEEEEEDDDDDGSPTSTLCFGARQRVAAAAGCHPLPRRRRVRGGTPCRLV
ncbi:hypothetical protein Cni_G04566 [Canna indica]|uniref:Uncharacterized protein n=1 Tax=Canna indica TaxID=4628 RepID=A0AAQ3Q4L9_9LILI|nr:hypothetical protein Cni_G04566 [Canna indica]